MGSHCVPKNNKIIKGKEPARLIEPWKKHIMCQITDWLPDRANTKKY